MEEELTSTSKFEVNETTTDEQSETDTIIASDGDADLTPLKQYQLKMSTNKKNAMNQMIEVINYMLKEDPCMEITTYDLWNADSSETPIAYPDEVPDTEAGRAPYFQPIKDKINKSGTSIVFRVTTNFSHMEWREKLAEKKTVRDLKLHFGRHKLESIDTCIIGFMANKIPTITHTERYEQAIQKKLPKGTPPFALERIHPKVQGGFEPTVKTDVIGIRVCKSDATVVDKVFAKLYPPQPEGVYYVSYTNLDEDVKRKVYKHNNWHSKKIKVISIPGFNNIDRLYDIGLEKKWSLRDFMWEQPTSTITVPIDVDNGGYKTKGTKILVLPKYQATAQKTFEEFRRLSKRTVAYDMSVDSMEDDVTTVNNNIKGNAEQLEMMFAAEEFPDIELTKPISKTNVAADSNSDEERKPKNARSVKKDSTSNKTKTKSQKFLSHADERSESATSKETTPARSYSQAASRNSSAISKEMPAPKSEMQDMKEMIEKMYKDNQKLYKLVSDGQEALTKSQTESRRKDEIIQNERRAEARQVQRFTKYVRETSNQMDRLLEVVDTLSKASSCGDDSTLSSVTESISEIYRRQRELNSTLAADKSIPSEVVMNKASKTSNVDRAGTEQTEITPDKNQDDDKSNSSSTDKKNDTASPNKDSANKDADGFQTPNRKHRASAASVDAALAMEGIVETRNSYTALTSLGTTRSRGPTPEKSPTDNRSPQKKKPKVNLKFRVQLNEAFAKQAEEVERETALKHPGKVDTGVTLLGRLANGAVHAAATATGFGTDKAMQDYTLTGEDNWQDSWEGSISDGEK
jgi:hypothetical protein